jgi:hypothetical protein
MRYGVLGVQRSREKGHGESYTPSPPIFFDILACPVVNIGHATSHPRFIYYVSTVPDVLECLHGSGKHVNSPSLPCTPL